MPTLTTDWKSYDLPSDMDIVDVDSDIAAYDPDAAPLLSLLTRLSKRSAHNLETIWFEDELVPRWGQVGSTASTTDETSIEMATSADAQVFDPGGAPGVVAFNPATDEQIVVTSIAGAVMTVQRGTNAADTDGSATVAADAGLLKLGIVDNENALSHTPLMTVPARKSNIMALIKDPMTMAGSELEINKWTGDDKEYQMHKLGVEHAVNVERMLWFGSKRSGAASTARICDGVLRFLSTNNKALTLALTETDIEDWITQIAKNTRGLNDQWWVFAPAKFIQAVNKFGRDKIQTVSGNDNPYGIQYTRYLSANGNINLVRHWMFEPAGFSSSDEVALERTAFALNLNNVTYRYLQNRDTKLHMNIQENDRDGEKHEYRTEFTVQVKLEKTHGKMTDSIDFI